MLQLVPTASVRPEQPSPTTRKSSVFGTAALLMKSEEVPEFVTVISWEGLIVPVSCAANVSAVGEKETADVPVLVEEGVQPESEAEAEVAPSLTVILHVEEL